MNVVWEAMLSGCSLTRDELGALGFSRVLRNFRPHSRPSITTAQSQNTVGASWNNRYSIHRTSSKLHKTSEQLEMHLMYTLDADGKRLYTLNKVVGAEVTKSAHPARFSPDDKYSR